jgi:hypothetical protein
MIRVFIVLQVAVVAAFGAGPPLQNFFRPFDGKNCDIVWEAPTNFPTSVRIFAVTPTKFASATISNLLELAELTPENKRRPVQQGVFLENDVLSYATRDDTRQVSVVPSQGFFAMSNDGVFAALPKQKPVGVPDDPEATTLALNLVRKLGLTPSELPQGSDGKLLPFELSEGTVLHKDKTSGQVVTNIISRTVRINRRIDGIPVSGMAGITIKFGNEGKLASLNWTWRAIKPSGLCPVPNAAQFVSRIRSGQTLIHPEHEGKLFQKLTIKQVQLYYWENEVSNPQTMIYPFAVLQADALQDNRTSKLEILVSFAND